MKKNYISLRTGKIHSLLAMSVFLIGFLLSSISYGQDVEKAQQEGNSFKTPVELLGEWTEGISKAKIDGKNRVLIVHATAKHNDGATINGVRLTYGGQPMTKIFGAGSYAPDQTAFISLSYVFILDEEGINAADNTGTIEATYQLDGVDVAAVSSHPTGTFYFSAFYENVDQLEHIRDSSYFISNVSVAAGTAMESRAVENESGDMGLIFYHNNGNNATITNNTDGFELAINKPGQLQGTSYIAYKACDGTAFIPSITASLGNRGSIMGLALKQVEEEGVPPVFYNLTANTTTGGTVIINPVRSRYAAGSVVTVQVISDYGFYLQGWTGDIDGVDDPTATTITVVMDKDKSITAVLDQYTMFTFKKIAENGTITVEPEERDSYISGTELTLTAKPDYGSFFLKWTGDLDGVNDHTATTITVLMDQNRSITAVFEQSPMFTLKTNVENGTVFLYPQPDADGGRYFAGATVRLTAQPHVGYVFSGWSGDLSGNQNPITVVVDKDLDITAEMLHNIFPLTIVANNGKVNILPLTGTEFPGGTQLILQAIPDVGYRFAGWKGDLTGKQNPTSITINSAKHIEALFELIPEIYTLKTNATNGSVSINPAGTSFEDGTVVTLTATPAENYRFIGWSGDLTSTDNPVSITIDGHKVITAEFEFATDVNDLLSSESGQSKLGQNYPNPFSVTTTIPYYLSKSGHVTLSVYNFTGQRMAVLVNDYQVSGQHTVEWNISGTSNGLPTNGLYVYRLEDSHGNVMTKKLMLNQ